MSITYFNLQYSRRYTNNNKKNSRTSLLYNRSKKRLPHHHHHVEVKNNNITKCPKGKPSRSRAFFFSSSSSSSLRKKATLFRYIFCILMVVGSISIVPFLLSNLENNSSLNKVTEATIVTEAIRVTKEVKVSKELKLLDGQCISPEFSSSPWLLNAENFYESSSYDYESTFSTTGFHRSCSFCSDNTAYLQELRNQIAVLYKEKCKDLVVYGAALEEEDDDYSNTDWLLEQQNNNHYFKSVQKHGTCFLQFISLKDTQQKTNNNKRSSPSTSPSSQHTHLILVDTDKMPYKHNRRNTKVLKFNPNLLFPWADRVIWQDTKLMSKPSMPIDYMLHFNRTVQRFNTCSSFVGLPPPHHHYYSTGSNNYNNKNDVTLKNHCNTIMNDMSNDDDDDINVVFTQCTKYEQKYKSNNDETKKSQKEVFHQNPLVDTDFIVYDMRTDDCRKFNGDFGCSWLDEIHCYSDRDQISFPHVLSSSGLQLLQLSSASASTEDNDNDDDETAHQYRDKVYVDENKVPKIHIAKRSCHWSFNSFSRCVAPFHEETTTTKVKQDLHLNQNIIPHNNNGDDDTKRVAIIVAGTMQRFMFDSTRINVLEYLKKEMKQEISIDYYVSLTTAHAKAYRSDSGYTDHWQPDPVLPRTKFHDDSIDVEEYIRSQIGKTSCSTGAIQILDSVDIDNEPMLKAKREKALQDHPTEDPDLRFPMIDVRSEAIGLRTANANRNLLRMHLAIQGLWEKALKWEREEDFRYDYVMFLRDDTLWLENFQLFHMFDMEGDVFIPACDARHPPLHPSEINDHIMISRRNVADLFGNYYSTLFDTDIQDCMDQLTNNKIEQRNNKRGCNSEMLLKWVTDKNNIQVTKLGQGEIPMQRSANVKLSDGSNYVCFHKYCQSKQSPYKAQAGKYKDTKMCNPPSPPSPSIFGIISGYF